MEKELLKLLREYYHFKFMTAGWWTWLWRHDSTNMNLYDFMEWLKSRQND